MTTNIPGYPVNFQAALPVATHQLISRPGWPVHQDDSTKTIKQ